MEVTDLNTTVVDKIMNVSNTQDTAIANLKIVSQSAVNVSIEAQRVYDHVANFSTQQGSNIPARAEEYRQDIIDLRMIINTKLPSYEANISAVTEMP